MEFTVPLGGTLYSAGSVILMVLYSPVGLILLMSMALSLGMKWLRS